MAKTITPEQLSAQIKNILSDYAEDLQGNLAEATRAVAKAGAKAVKSKARSAVGGTGKYAGGWTSKVEEGRLYSTGVIYNGKAPGLPHLMEHGHANRNGGRTPGRVHIAPVEEQVVKEFEEEVSKSV